MNIKPVSLTDDLMVRAIPAFADNYLWMLSDRDGNATVVDPGDAASVQAALGDAQLKLRSILLTHHHPDHIGGVTQLVEQYRCPVFGPQDDRLPKVDKVCRDGDALVLNEPAMRLRIMHLPGHTRSHIAYVGHGAAFVGDTLFSGGCGRMFEGTAPEMLNSLERLAALPPETLVFCAHEYTRDNLRFALEWEPENSRLQQRYAEVCTRREQGLGSLPTTIGAELTFNPFLRCDDAQLRARLSAKMSAELDRVAAFAALRTLKNTYVAQH